jgi:hypothetical protein
VNPRDKLATNVADLYRLCVAYALLQLHQSSSNS